MIFRHTSVHMAMGGFPWLVRAENGIANGKAPPFGSGCNIYPESG